MACTRSSSSVQRISLRSPSSSSAVAALGAVFRPILLRYPRTLRSANSHSTANRRHHSYQCQELPDHRSSVSPEKFPFQPTSASQRLLFSCHSTLLPAEVTTL